jgi:hypothetical protein
MTNAEYKELKEAYDNYFMSLYQDIHNPSPPNHDFLFHRQNQSNQKLYLQLQQQHRQR